MPITFTATESKSTTLSFDKDHLSTSSSPVVVEGKNPNIVHVEIDQTNNQCKVFFTDVGAYTIKMNAIKLVEMNGVIQKFSLKGLEKITKNVMAHMIYGL